jgi:hypothetical protein
VSDTNKHDASGKPVTQNANLIYTLKERMDKRSIELVKEGASLKMDITALEKDRRHMHSLLLDLIHALEQDVTHNARHVIREVHKNMKTAFPVELDLDDASSPQTLAPPVPPKSALKKSTTEQVNLGTSPQILFWLVSC